MATTAALLFAASVAALLVRDPIPGDLAAVEAAHDLTGRHLDGIMRIVALTGSAWVLAPLALALAAWSVWARRPRVLLLVIAASVLVWVGNPALKRLFERDRPRVREYVEPVSRYAFPSGHAIASMTFACLVVLLAWPTRARVPVLAAAVVYVAAVGTTRIVLGVHWPSDLVAGWALGAAVVCGLGAWLLAPEPQRRPDSSS